MRSTFGVVAEPARRRILDLLLGGGRTVGELVSATGMSQPNTSRHLRILRDAGLVDSRADGQRRVYELRGEGFAELARWMTPYALLHQGGSAALERHLARARPTSDPTR
jgi:DNA-binding transcriptional ArsR family regulator